MSIATKQGDDGTTGLMYGARVAKCHPRVEACGAVDELNAALGLARATASDPEVREAIHRVQQDLITLMGELATPVEALQRYEADGYPRVRPAMIDPIDAGIKAVESLGLTVKGWVLPGASMHSAALDVARTVCRRAERRVVSLRASGQLDNDAVLVLLNRLSDLLWLWARLEESRL